MDESSILHVSIDQECDFDVTKSPKGPYEELRDGNIRLLQISPRSAKSDISCRITSVSLQDNPVYTALSYVWGRGPDNSAIWLNGHRIYIRKNLWRFLHQARELGDNTFGWLWIDALCIDQGNNEERTRQVNLMAKIYSTASQVVVWLGPAYGDSDVAMRELSKPISYWHGNKRLLSVWARSAGTAIRRVCIRPYWTRLWVLQELLLAKEVRIMCGARVNPWKPFRDFLLEIRGTQLTERVGGRFEFEAVRASPALSMVEKTIQPLDETKLWDLMFATQHLSCVETRDKIYALLGVAEGGHANISPDYGMTLSTLLNLVLKDHHKHESPRSLEEVANQCEQLENLTGAPDWSMSYLPDRARLNFPFLHAHIQPNSPGQRENYNIVWWATFYGHYSVIKLLCADRDFSIDKAMLHAIARGNRTAVQLILDADKSARKSFDRKKQLLLALERMEDSIMETLLHDSNIVVDIPDIGSRVVELRNQNECMDVDLAVTDVDETMDEAMEEAISKIYDIHHPRINDNIDPTQCYGLTPLQRASKTGCLSAVELLLNEGKVNVNMKDGLGRTPLHYAVRKGRKEVVKLLTASNRVKVNARDAHSRTPLQYALQEGQGEIAEIMLHTGKADVTGKGISAIAYTPLWLAVKYNHEALVQRLLKSDTIDKAHKGEVVNWILDSKVADYSSEAMIKLLLDSGEVDFEQDQRGVRVIGLAIRRDYVSVLENLLETDRVDPRQTDPVGRVALDEATKGGNKEIIELLEFYCKKWNSKSIRAEDGKKAAAIHQVKTRANVLQSMI